MNLAIIPSHQQECMMHTIRKQSRWWNPVDTFAHLNDPVDQGIWVTIRRLTGKSCRVSFIDVLSAWVAQTEAIELTLSDKDRVRSGGPQLIGRKALVLTCKCQRGVRL